MFRHCCRRLPADYPFVGPRMPCLAVGSCVPEVDIPFCHGRYHELYDVVDLFVVLEMGGSVSHNLEYIRKHRPRLNFDPTLFDRRFRNKTLHVKLDGSLMHSSNPFENQGMMRTHGFASAYRRARGCRGHTVGKDGISNDLLLLSDIDEIPRSRVLRGLLEQSAVWSRLEAGEAPCSTTWPAKPASNVASPALTISGRMPRLVLRAWAEG